MITIKLVAFQASGFCAQCVPPPDALLKSYSLTILLMLLHLKEQIKNDNFPFFCTTFETVYINNMLVYIFISNIQIWASIRISKIVNILLPFDGIFIAIFHFISTIINSNALLNIIIIFLFFFHNF